MAAPSDVDGRERRPAGLTARFPVRRLACPHCGAAFDAPRRAISIRCPACTGQLQLQDAVLSSTVQGTVRTLGHVRIARRGSVTGQIECGCLQVDGAMNAAALVHGPSTFTPKSRATGSLRTRSIVVAPGAVLDLDLIVGDTVGARAATSAVDEVRRRLHERSAAAAGA